MKHNSVSVGDMPNAYLLAKIVDEAHELFVGAMITPQRIDTIKRFIRDRVAVLIYENKWLTIAVYQGRKMEFQRIEVLYEPKRNPNELKIIPIWEFKEEDHGTDSITPYQGYMEGEGWPIN